MLYCEKCKRVCASESDCICGGRAFREADPQDYCYLIETNEMLAKMLEDSFTSNDIKCVLVPSGNGYRSALGLSLGNFIIYVTYEKYNEAVDIVEYFDKSSSDNIREDLIEHKDSWNITPKMQKKFRKKMKLAEDEDLFEHINELLCNAADISDDGLIGSCQYCGHYITVRSEKLKFWFNSATYEILL